MAGICVVGVDSGLAAFGVAVAELDAQGLRFTRVEVWRTKPSSKRLRLRKCDDTAERVRTLAGCLHQLLAEQKPVAICIEAVALPFGRIQSSVVSALGRCRGVVDALAEAHQLPVLEESAQRLKVATAGKANATKDAVREGLEATYPALRGMWPAPSSIVEHAADACAAIHACRNSDVVLAAIRARDAR